MPLPENKSALPKDCVQVGQTGVALQEEEMGGRYGGRDSKKNRSVRRCLERTRNTFRIQRRRVVEKESKTDIAGWDKEQTRRGKNNNRRERQIGVKTMHWGGRMSEWDGGRKKERKHKDCVKEKRLGEKRRVIVKRGTDKRKEK